MNLLFVSLTIMESDKESFIVLHLFIVFMSIKNINIPHN